MNSKTKALATAGIFAGLIFLLGMTPIGLIPLGFINLTIVHIPVIVGAIVTSRRVALALGGAFGIASTLAAFGMSLAAQSGLAGMLLEKSPLALIIMCIVPRLLIPMTTRMTYEKLTASISSRSTQKNKKKRSLAIIVSSVVGSLTNTVFYLGLMGIFFSYYGLWNAFTGILSTTLFIGAACEAIAAALIAVPVVNAVSESKKSGFDAPSVKLADDEAAPSEDEDDGGVDDCNVAILPATDSLLPELTPVMQRKHDKCMEYLRSGAVVMADAAFNGFAAGFEKDEDLFNANMYAVMRFIEMSKYQTASVRLAQALKNDNMPQMLTPDNKHLVLGIMNIIHASVVNDAPNPVHAKVVDSMFTEATDLVLADNIAEAAVKFLDYIDSIGAKDRVIQNVEECEESYAQGENEPEYNSNSFTSARPVIADDPVEEGIGESAIAVIPTAAGVLTNISGDSVATDTIRLLGSRATETDFENFVCSVPDVFDRINADLFVILTYLERRMYKQTVRAITRCLRRDYSRDIFLSDDTNSVIVGILNVVNMSVKNMMTDEDVMLESDNIMHKTIEFVKQGAIPIAIQTLGKYYIVSGLAKSK